MSYRRFKLAEVSLPPATVATFATVPPEKPRTVANVAIVAEVWPENPRVGASTVASVATVAGSKPISAKATTDEDRQAELDERAAVLEYDEGLPRAEAEQLAREQTGTRCSRKIPTVGNLSPSAAPQAPAPRVVVAPEPVRFVQPPVTFGPGVTRTLPVVEVPPHEYDAHLGALIAAAGAGTVDAAVLSHKKRKGICVRRGEEMIYTRGRH